MGTVTNHTNAPITQCALGEAVDAAGAAKRIFPTVVLLFSTYSTTRSNRCLKVCVEARDDADATPLERKCASMRARGVRTAVVNFDGTATSLFLIGDTDVRQLVRWLCCCRDIQPSKLQACEVIRGCEVIRDIPEGYFMRVDATAHEMSGEPTVLQSLTRHEHDGPMKIEAKTVYNDPRANVASALGPEFDNAYVICLNVMHTNESED
jgi:hypothetical protein